MKIASVRIMLAVVIGGLMAIATIAWNSGQAEAKAARPGEVVITGTVTASAPASTKLDQPAGRAKLTPLHYQPGTLLRGSDGDVYYLTEAGTRRRIHDRATLRAFGLAEKYITNVDDDLLAMIPLAEELTRLVRYPQGNLYWVMDGQRWLVNEWLPVVTRPDYTGVPVSPLDSWLERSLAVRLSFENGTLLTAGNTVYYFNAGSITPVTLPSANQAIVRVPAGVLTVYEPETQLAEVYLTLRSAQAAVEVRQGPGRQYEALGVVGNKVLVEGRTEAGNWLLVRYQNQRGWLAADQLADPVGSTLVAVVAVDKADEVLASLSPAQPATVASNR